MKVDPTTTPIKSIEGLNWNHSPELQRLAREAISGTARNDLSFLVMPRQGKEYWQNAAIILTEIGRPKIDRYIPELLEWLQDMNWPGALEIFELLRTFDEASIGKYSVAALARARSEGEAEWEETLISLIKHIEARAIRE